MLLLATAKSKALISACPLPNFSFPQAYLLSRRKPGDAQGNHSKSHREDDLSGNGTPHLTLVPRCVWAGKILTRVVMI